MALLEAQRCLMATFAGMMDRGVYTLPGTSSNGVAHLQPCLRWRDLGVECTGRAASVRSQSRKGARSVSAVP
jgi:hypothetical protein